MLFNLSSSFQSEIYGNNKMKISGLNGFTLVNYPNKISCVLFAQGCPLHCKYCYNKRLLTEPLIEWQEIEDFLRKRQGSLEAVVISGGEPMLQYKELKKASLFVKSLGYNLGLHLTGLNSDKSEFKEIVELADWIGLDFKAPENKYKEICGLNYNDFLRALDIIMNLNKDFEIRTTLDKKLTKEDLLEMQQVLLNKGINKWYLQRLMLNEGTFNIPDYDLNDFEIDIQIR